MVSAGAGPSAGRIEAFSDGVFAIAITLLVLAVGVPPSDKQRGPELLRLWPSYLAYAMSFIVIGAIRINHHAQFGHIARTDGTLMILNLLQLMDVAFIPFPTAVLAQAFLAGRDEPIPAAFYGGVLAVLGVFVCVTWFYALRFRFLVPSLSPDQARKIGRRYLIGPTVYTLATLVALVAPWVAVATYVLVNAFYLWPSRLNAVAGEGSGE